MCSNPFTPRFSDLPDLLPIFPLDGVLLLPRGQLPLNIFEPRYLAMVSDALKHQRMIGMVQPSGRTPTDKGLAVFNTGCAGRITQFEETDDGRYLITLTGVCRFNIFEELDPARGYRRVVPDWSLFESDMERVGCLDLDRSHLTNLLHDYFEMQQLSMDWSLLDAIPDEGLMTALAMICPLSAKEKQALLEAPCCRSRAQLFYNLLEMAVREGHHPECNLCSSH